MKLTPLWTDNLNPPAFVPLFLPTKVDVAIIGSGYTGLHAAAVLANQGASVAVLEANTIGWGASSRNGGMVNPGLKLTAPELFHRYGEEMGARLWRWSMAAIDFVEEFINKYSIACDFHRHGQVVLAAKPQHLATLRQEAQWHRTHLADAVPQLIGPAELQTEIGSQAYFGGLSDSRAAGLHPAKYVYALAEVAARAGAILVEQAPVTSLSKSGNGFQLMTSGSLIQAEAVILATNGYTNHLVPAARRGIFAGGSYIITTGPLSAELQKSVSPQGRMFYDTKHFLNYFRLTPDGRMLLGGRHNLSTGLSLEKSATELQRRMLEIFPQLGGIELSHSWTGKLGLTFDLMPHAGRIQEGPVPGIFYAYGYGGHGVGVASYLGNAMGKMIAGLPFDNPFAELPHARYFFTPYEKFYLPLISAWFRFLDRVS